MRLRTHDGFGDTLLPTEAHLLKGLAAAAGAALVVVIALAQVRWAPHVSIFPFYALPIGLATMTFGKRWGLVWAYACMGACLWAALRPDHLYAHLWIPYFNALARLPFFLLVVYGVGRWRARRAVRAAQAPWPPRFCTCCDRVRMPDGAWARDDSIQSLRTAPGVSKRICTDCARKQYALGLKTAAGY